MAIHYNQKATLVTNSMVYSVTTDGLDIDVNGDVNGSYQFKGTIQSGYTGCGNPEIPYVNIKLKDDITWTKMTCFFEMTGTASCWWFNQGDGNFQNYSEAAGDRIFRDTNAFSSNSNFVKKLSACDNNSNNFFHATYATGGATSVKSFYVTSRRISNGNRSGPYHKRSCNLAGYYILIKNIFIF